MTFTATVSGSNSPTGTVQFTVDGSNAGAPVALISGKAKFSISTLTVGAHNLTAAYSGDKADAASVSGTLTQTVTPPSTTITVASASGSADQAITLSAVLKKTGGTGLNGKTLTFSVDGATVGTATTNIVVNVSGTATLRYTIPSALAVGSHSLLASFAGDSSGSASSGTGTLTVAKSDTTVTVTNAVGTRGKAVPLTARLRRTKNGINLSGETLSFSVDGITVGTGMTASNGVATLSYVIPVGAKAGTHALTVSFVATTPTIPAAPPVH